MMGSEWETDCSGLEKCKCVNDFSDTSSKDSCNEMAERGREIMPTFFFFLLIFWECVRDKREKMLQFSQMDYRMCLHAR